MKNKATTNNNDDVTAAENNLSQPRSEKAGVVKRFLNWIAKGADKTKTCPT